MRFVDRTAKPVSRGTGSTPGWAWPPRAARPLRSWARVSIGDVPASLTAGGSVCRYEAALESSPPSEVARVKADFVQEVQAMQDEMV